MGINDSILKEILTGKNCSFGKYLSFMKIERNNGAEIGFYITPVSTLASKDFLIISLLINNNWHEAIHNIDHIVDHLKNLYKIKTESYIMILHSYFDVVQIEKFYLIDPDSRFKLKILKINEFEKLLD